MNFNSTRFLLILFILSVSGIHAQTLINTSFESTDNYVLGTVNGKNKWTVTSGSGVIVNQADYAKDGTQALKLSAVATALQVDNIANVSNATALAGDVYVDFWIRLKSLPTVNFAITGYDLGTYTHRSFMMEFQTTGKLKLYDGSSGWAIQPVYAVDTWTRISVKIDNGGATYQVAINGVVQNKTFAFREIKNGATAFDFHSIRFSMSSGTCDVALDNMYVGSSPITDVAFAASSSDRSIILSQPAFGTITLSPVKTKYQLNDQVTATVYVPEHYLFTGWTGDLTGTSNPMTFTVNKNYSIGATVTVDPANPPAQSTVTVNQPVGATITLAPQQTSYYDGTTVTATLTIQSGYLFNGWSGVLSGTTNPTSFVVNGATTIGANVSEILIQPVTRIVSTVTQFKDAIDAMNPGDSVLVLDGTYNIGGLTITRGGSALKPIVIKSMNLFGAKIIGPTYFNTSYQNYVTYEGFEFNVDPESTIFKMEGCSYVRITRNWFKMIASADTTQTSKWISIGDIWANPVCNSHHNRIDHNLFEGKYDQGAWMIIDGSHGTVPDVTKHDRIDHNIFRGNTPRVTNEKETIRVGVSDLSQLNAYTVIENNLFEDCDGDPEIISVKSCCDTVRNNTIRHSLGVISLRQGNNSVVEGNFVFGEGKTGVFDGGTIGCGGVRVYGLNHKIYNNYFEGLTGSKWDAACTLTNGDVTNTSTSLSSHFLPENIVFAFNTLVNNKSNIEIGFDNNASYGKSPINCKIANNIIVAAENPIVKYYSTTSLAGVSFQSNIMYPTGTSTLGLTGTNDTQIKIADPKLIKTNCKASGQNCNRQTPFEVYKLTAESPAIDASVGYEYVTQDMENQLAIGIRDIGADEYNFSTTITNGPIDETMAGPNGPETITYERNTPTGIQSLVLTDLIASPNPFNKSTLLTFPVTISGKAIIEVYNAVGQQILRMDKQLEIGNNQLEINTDVLGLLLCRIRLSEKEYNVKLISK